MNITINDCAIPIIDDPLFDYVLYVELWRVWEITGVYYPTKLLAEMAVRQRFPDEDPSARYARISYVRFIPGDL